MADATTIENEYAAGLAESRNRDAAEEPEEESEEPERAQSQEKKVDFGTALLMGMVGLFFGLLSSIPFIGFLFNAMGVGAIFLWWFIAGLKPPTFGVASKIPLAQQAIRKSPLSNLDPGEKVSKALESIPVLGKFIAFFLPLFLGIIPGTGVLFLPGLVWMIYTANK
jgi:hypothetical protein